MSMHVSERVCSVCMSDCRGGFTSTREDVNGGMSVNPCPAAPGIFRVR